MSNRLNRDSKAVAHHSPGRTRIKVPKSHRKKLHEIKDALSKTAGVRSVEINHDTGSVLVHHEHDLPIFETLHKAVENVSVDLLTTLIEGETAQLMGGVGIAAAGLGLIGTVGKSFFESVREGSKSQTLITGQASDLKTIVPTAFLIAAAVKAYETKSFWQGLTPLALAYWAFDTYWRFNVANPAVFEPKNGQGHAVESELS